jgi:hypothetical protein
MDLKTEDGLDDSGVKNIVFVLTAYLRHEFGPVTLSIMPFSITTFTAWSR